MAGDAFFGFLKSCPLGILDRIWWKMCGIFTFYGME
jgi:hypothetical protein